MDVNSEHLFLLLRRANAVGNRNAATTGIKVGRISLGILQVIEEPIFRKRC
jgi:hypothetical protein